MSRLDTQLSPAIIILILDLPHIIKQHLRIDPSQPKLVSRSRPMMKLLRVMMKFP
jgi:hypothetical protein